MKLIFRCQLYVVYSQVCKQLEKETLLDFTIRYGQKLIGEQLYEFTKNITQV